jgi:predicted AlkP superfamily pyrophosphatase or phosphodiesterase
MIQDCYNKPAGLYREICNAIGQPFNLMHYWGPMASMKSSQWITEATCYILNKGELSPDLCMTYLPVMDYDLQRYGLDNPKSKKALATLVRQLTSLIDTAKANNYEILIFGDYAINNCQYGAVFPNRMLYEAGLLSTREVNSRLYPDIYQSKAFAMVDHEIAHVYVRNKEDINAVTSIFNQTSRINRIMDGPQKKEAGIAHVNAGDLIITAEPGYWLAYPWWSDSKQAPDYASHVDIHNKPGYDPCELFFGWPPGSVSSNPDKIKGSHGILSSENKTCWASTFTDKEHDSIVNLAKSTQLWLKENS